MFDTHVIAYLFDLLITRLREARLDPDRGDVAEKIVIVGVFVALALGVGLIVKTAVTTDATNIARQIVGAK